jgi:outer membrane protein OmpA-like peptidoglycan-associated protein
VLTLVYNLRSVATSLCDSLLFIVLLFLVWAGGLYALPYDKAVKEIRTKYKSIENSAYRTLADRYTENEQDDDEDSSDTKARKLADETQVLARKNNIVLTIQNVDIKKYPMISLICEAVDEDGMPVDTIEARGLTVVENGKEHRVISAKKISINERVPVDFMFALDVTQTMQPYINGVRDNIERFVDNLLKRGIDYRVGLILFSDNVEKIYEPTRDVSQFLKWLANVRAIGGDDTPENALEALKESSNIEFRPSANKVIVLITDAPYHQKGMPGKGTTEHTTESIIQLLKQRSIRTFTITPLFLKQYEKIALDTRGKVFDIKQSFSKILDAYSTQLTNLFAITYRSDEPAIPDSINVAILNDNKQTLLRKTIPIVQIGRRLIIENLLFQFGQSSLPDAVPELEVLAEFMKNVPKVKIRIEGHTDSRGTPSGNKRLSYARAESVKAYLTQRKGIGVKRISTIGYGDTRPIGDNNTEFGRNLNRRTEVLIIEK